MQMPEVSTRTYRIYGSDRQSIRGYEHAVSLVLPWRRYREGFVPIPVEGSPSRIEVDAPERFGTLLTVFRVSRQPFPTDESIAEMTGELAEAWVSMTLGLKVVPK